MGNRGARNAQYGGLPAYGTGYDPNYGLDYYGGGYDPYACKYHKFVLSFI